MATIILTLDGSASAEQAIPQALGRLRPDDELLLLRVVEPTRTLEAPGDTFAEVEVKAAKDYLVELARQLEQRACAVKVRTEVRCGSPREEIVAVAARESASLIVTASHGRTGLARWLLGSVAESVVRKATCPVWLVRCGEQSARPDLSRVLLPVDTSEHPREVLEFVRAQLNKPTVTLQLLCATNIAWMSQTEVCGGLVAEIRSVLEALAETLRAEGWRVEVALDPGAPAEAILDAATDWRADLIVLASHRRTGFQRWFLGSVTEKVVRHAHCPVAVVRAAPEEAGVLARTKPGNVYAHPHTGHG